MSENDYKRWSGGSSQRCGIGVFSRRAVFISLSSQCHYGLNQTTKQTIDGSEPGGSDQALLRHESFPTVFGRVSRVGVNEMTPIWDLRTLSRYIQEPVGAFPVGGHSQRGMRDTSGAWKKVGVTVLILVFLRSFAETR